MNLNIESFTRCYNRPTDKWDRLICFSIQEPTSEITPSLAALDDAQTLRRKEWKRGEPGEDMPRQYSTASRHLTPTQPKHEDMRMDSTLNVTLEGSLNDLSAAVGGIEDSTREHEMQWTPEKEVRDVCPSTTVVTSTEGTPHTFVKSVPGRDLSEQGLNQVEPPRRILRTREVSREDDLASTRQFFASVNVENQVVTSELPVEVWTVTPEGNTTLNLNIPITSATLTITETETRSSRTLLPNGSPSRPTATATCRPLMWVQCGFGGTDKWNSPRRYWLSRK